MRKLRNQKGFTLMELMVVIVIVAILAAVAVPLYINYVKDAKRTEAKGAIAAVISAQQVFYQNSLAEGAPSYSNDADLYDDADLKVDLVELRRSWDITIVSASATNFVVKAVGKADAAALVVCCTYDRATGATWGDSATDCP